MLVQVYTVCMSVGGARILCACVRRKMEASEEEAKRQALPLYLGLDLSTQQVSTCT